VKAVEAHATIAQKDDAHVAAKQLEAFFLRRLLAEARPEGGGALDGGFAGDTFKQMLDEQIADKMAAAGGIGLADMFAGQLTAPGEAPSSRPAGSLQDLPPVHAPGTIRELPRSAPVQDLPMPNVPFVLPVAGRPTSGYGLRTDPIRHVTSKHPGFDLAAPTGTPVAAAASGTVVHAGPAGTYGNLITIRHENGLETRYAHLSAVDIQVGAHVEAGQPIGKVGTTGYSTGPHLHFEVRRDGQTVDPAPLLPLNSSRSRTSR
jgi:murein DD-endopeptidase MepM/ murein hydrolase activator NlpD